MVAVFLVSTVVVVVLLINFVNDQNDPCRSPSTVPGDEASGAATQNESPPRLAARVNDDGNAILLEFACPGGFMRANDWEVSATLAEAPLRFVPCSGGLRDGDAVRISSQTDGSATCVRGSPGATVTGGTSLGPSGSGPYRVLVAHAPTQSIVLDVTLTL